MKTKFRACPKCASDDLSVIYHKKHKTKVFDWERDRQLNDCDNPTVEGLKPTEEHLFVHGGCHSLSK